MDDSHPYEAPALTEIGTLHELTLLHFKKVGSSPDVLSGITIGNTTVGNGSITPTPRNRPNH